MTALKAPFPYFGGKSRVALEVWARLGDVPRYIEPFAGSLAVLLARPQPFTGREIVNDSDGLLVNAWRGMVSDPAAVAHWADWPATENDLHARHAWLVGKREDITRRLEGDPDWFDPKAAGWWLWGIGLWIGGGWCSGNGPWRVSEDGQLLHAGDDGQGIHRQLLHAGNDGQEGTTAEASTGSAGVKRPSPANSGSQPRGLQASSRAGNVEAIFAEISTRLRGALVMCGDWTRVVTPAVMFGSSAGRGTGDGLCGVFLDPPYGNTADRTADLYAHDSQDVAHAVREWAIANGDDPRLRIALAGYEGEHDMPESWAVLEWSTRGGYSGHSSGTKAAANRRRERVWFSPHCHRAGLWEGVA
jgi:hypothetical protein